MKKLISLLLILILLITGCVNREKPDEEKLIKDMPEKIISARLYSYDVSYWQEHENEQDSIAKEIYDLWKGYGEAFGINMIVTAEKTKTLINDYIQQYNSDKDEKIFVIACMTVDIDSDSYKIE